MNVSCPDCRSVFRVDPAKVTSEKLRARCSVCGGIIAVGTGASWADAFADVPERIDTPRSTTSAWGAGHWTPASGPTAPNDRATPVGSRPVLPGESAVAAPEVHAAFVPPEAKPLAAAASNAPVQPRVEPVAPPSAPAAAASAQSQATAFVPELGTPAIGLHPSAASVPRPPSGQLEVPATEVGPPAQSAPPRSSSLAVPFQPPVIETPQAKEAPASAPAPRPEPHVPAPGGTLAGPGAATPVHPGRATPVNRGPLTPRRLTPIGGNPSYHRGPTRPASPAFGAPLPPPPRTSIPTPVASSAMAPVAEPPVVHEPARRQINPFLANDPNAKARRLARALVSDMIVYHPTKREEGLRNGTLKQLFREEIKKSYEEYIEQVGREFAEGTTHFQDALNDVLAGGRRLF